MERVCKWCGETFEAASNTQMYCSKRCRANCWYHEKKSPGQYAKNSQCVVCGSFYTAFSHKSLCCSHECRLKRRSGRPVSRVCKECGSEFPPSRVDQVFCSCRCGSKHWRRGNRDRVNELSRAAMARQGRKHQMKWAAKNPQKVKAHKKKYRLKNKETIALQRSEYTQSPHGRALSRASQRKRRAERNIGNLIIERNTYDQGG